MSTNQIQSSKRRSMRSLVLAKATALCLMSTSAMAALVDSGTVNIPIPDNIDGVYFNVVTGAGSNVPPAGWDLNPYSAVAGQFNLWGATANTWFNPQAVITGNYNLPLGTVIQGAATAFFRPGGGTNVATQFTLNSNQNFLGFRFANEANGGANHFGFIQVQFGATAGVRSIVRYVYDNVADTAVTVAVGPTNVAPTLAVAGTTLNGGTGSVTPTITTPAQGTGSTVFACSIPATAPSNFAITSNASQTVTTSALAIGLSCAPQAAATTATLTCTQTATPAPNPANATATITCPAAGATVVAGTASGATVTLPGYILPSGSSSAALSFTSNGNSSVLNCTATGAGFSVAPNPLNLATGVAGSVVVTYTGSVVGTFTGNLSCTTTSAGGPFTYTLSATVGPAITFVPVPALGSAATWILILSALGMGLLVVGARQRD
jgi:hypothetical protein